MGEAPTIAWTKLLETDYYYPWTFSVFANTGHSVSTASDGSIYVAGGTNGGMDGQPTIIRDVDAFITKFNSDGSKAWTKILGSSSGDEATSVCTASDGTIYVAGYTRKGGRYPGDSDVIFEGQINNGNDDAFLTKFNSDGSKSWTKLVGGTGNEEVIEVRTFIDGSIYLVGSTTSSFDGQSNTGKFGKCHFITKFNSDGSKAWTKLLGGDISVASTASDGSIYIHDYDFVTKFNSDGSKAWATKSGQRVGALTIASDGSIYISGNEFVTINGQTFNESDVYITKFNSDGSKAWTKLVGGTSYKSIHSLSSDSDGSAYIMGITRGNIDGQPHSGGWDTFVTKFNSDGSKAWSKLVGLSLDDYAGGVSAASDGSIFITGRIDRIMGLNTHIYTAFITKLNSDGSSSNTGTGSIYYNPTTNNTLTSWNIYRVDNSVKAGDIVSQWFGTAAPATTQLQDISETKLMDVVASTWSDKVKINRVVKATDAGGKIEAKQIDFTAGEVAGSVVSGGKGNDDIKGFAGWDNLEGGDGNDLIHGGNGRDIISGGAGRDELHGDFGWNTYRSEKDGASDLIAVKSDHYLVNWLYGKAGNSPNGEKSDIIEGLDPVDKIRIIGVDTSEITFAANISAKGVTGIGIYGKGILEALYTGGDLTVAQITQMTSGDASAAAMSNSVNSYGVW